MKKSAFLLTTVFILVFGIALSYGQGVSEEARRHFDRGMVALDMAKSPAECEPAIKEFEQAARLAPDWPHAFYNLGAAQAKAEKYGDAVRSFQQYLRLAPNADDAEDVKSIINKLEYKAEQFISDSDALDIFATIGHFTKNGEVYEGKWENTGHYAIRSYGHSFRRVGNAIEFKFGSPQEETGIAHVKGLKLEYESFFQYSLSDGIILSLKVVMEILSRTRIKVSAVETGFKDGHVNTFNFEYILK